MPACLRACVPACGDGESRPSTSLDVYGGDLGSFDGCDTGESDDSSDQTIFGRVELSKEDGAVDVCMLCMVVV